MNAGRHGELEYPTCFGGFFNAEAEEQWKGDLRSRRTRSGGPAVSQLFATLS